MSETQYQRETNKQAAHQLYDVWDGGNEAIIDDVMAEDVIFNKPDHLGGQVHGRDAYKENLRMVRAAFSDLYFTAHDVVAEDDQVIAFCTFGGTHDGAIFGIEPTGASVDVWDFVKYRFDDGKVVEVTSLPDFFGLFLELGVIEPPGER